MMLINFKIHDLKKIKKGLSNLIPPLIQRLVKP